MKTNFNGSRPKKYQSLISQQLDVPHILNYMSFYMSFYGDINGKLKGNLECGPAEPSLFLTLNKSTYYSLQLG